MSWASVALADLCNIEIGKTPSRAEPDYWRDGTLPWLSIADMNQGRYLRATKERVTEAGAQAARMRPVKPGTLLLSYKLSIGKVGIAQVPLYTNEAIAALSNLRGDVDVDFMYWALQHVDLLQGADRAAMGATLNKAKLSEIRFPIPPLEEQRRIAAILDKADALRAKRREAIAKLDQLLQSMFLDMFGDPVSNPHGWSRVVFSELLDRIESGTSPVCLDRPAEGDEWAVLKLGAVTRCEFDPSANKALPSSLEPDPSLEVKAGDLLFTRKNTPDLVAACAFVSKTPPRLLLPDLIFRLCLKDSAAVRPQYLQALLTHPGKRKEIQRLAGGSAGSMPNISKSKLMGASIELPPIGIQMKFEQRLIAIYEIREKYQRSLSALDSCLASLQKRAFSGKA